MRDRKYTMRRGPLLIYAEDSGITRALRNLPGVDSAHVDRLNLLQLAPGGNFGRFVIWTEDAFKRLSSLYGDGANASNEKKGYHLPRAMMTNADVARIINSDEIQSVVVPAKEAKKTYGKKRNALKNEKVMLKLNPAAKTKDSLRKRTLQAGTKENEAAKKKKAKTAADAKKTSKASKQFYSKMMAAYDAASQPKKDEEADAAGDEE